MHGLFDVQPCPNCKEDSLPRFTGCADAVACQNPKCRVVVDQKDVIIGQWSAGYKELTYA